MSMFVRVHVNDGLIGEVEITNRTGHTGVNDVNTYAWTFNGDGQRMLDGTVDHRYGDGAIVLAHKVIGQVAMRYQVVAHLDHSPAGVSDCPLCASLAAVES